MRSGSSRIVKHSGDTVSTIVTRLGLKPDLNGTLDIGVIVQIQEGILAIMKGAAFGGFGDGVRIECDLLENGNEANGVAFVHPDELTHDACGLLATLMIPHSQR